MVYLCLTELFEIELFLKLNPNTEQFVIELFLYLTVCKQKHVPILNWIVWNRTVYMDNW